MSDTKWILQVEIFDNGQVVEALEFDQNKIKVGQLATSQLRLDDPNVSRIHAVLERLDDGTYQAIDLGSASGTYVNGQKITKATVRDGDEMRFGDTTVRLCVIDPAAREAERRQAAAAAAAAAPAVVPEGHIELEDGSVVEPYSMEGYYDDAGNYIPGYYDEDGVYHYGYGYRDDDGQWQVAHGFYDAEGEWVPTDAPEGPRRSDTEVYTENFFQGRPGDVLEVAFLWSDYVLDVQSITKAQNVFIGSDEENEYVIEDPALQVAKFPLITFVEGRGYRLNFSANMEGMIQRDGQQLRLDEAIAQGLATPSNEANGSYSIPLVKGTSARLDFGRNTFLIHFTSLPALVGAAFGVEKAPIFYQGMSLALHLAFMFLVFTLPAGYGGLELHDFAADDRFVELLTPPEEEEEEEEDISELFEDSESSAAESDVEHVEVEEMTSEQAVEHNTEVVQETQTMQTVEAMTQQLTASLGGSLDSMLDNMGGSEVAAGLGAVALAGGGRTGPGGDRGHGPVGTGAGDGVGDGPNVGLGDREVREPRVIVGDPAITGSLDREIIQRVVRQNRRQMQHCYSEQLQRNPNLAGQIVMTWRIAPNGSVVSASVASSTMNNPAVEQCMARRIQRWTFPEPDGAGFVTVNYPFNFSS